jgi:hypothetical protein
LEIGPDVVTDSDQTRSLPEHAVMLNRQRLHLSPKLTVSIRLARRNLLLFTYSNKEWSLQYRETRPREFLGVLIQG